MVIKSLTIPIVQKNLSLNLEIDATGVVNEPRYRHALHCHSHHHLRYHPHCRNLVYTSTNLFLLLATIVVNCVGAKVNLSFY